MSTVDFQQQCDPRPKRRDRRDDQRCRSIVSLPQVQDGSGSAPDVEKTTGIPGSLPGGESGYAWRRNHLSTRGAHILLRISVRCFRSASSASLLLSTARRMESDTPAVVDGSDHNPTFSRHFVEATRFAR